ncbi:MAG: sulfopyruvate decarboxylase subunit beta [Candidatus Methanoplasma sp.]|jgi:sulfopyruvate decarboxylase subunit beta|nr:sulfopyruvate decarboxylase subunit beta [Candidatus Methanoplasma sp.]
MNEDVIIEALKESGVDTVASLPCDRNKVFTEMLPKYFRTVDLTREEDGVGICAGVYLGGGRPALSIQSSGIGNMLNALLSLTRLYKLPLPIIASWRGVEDEPIAAQIPFNASLPKLLEAYGIKYTIISNDNIQDVKSAVAAAFSELCISVVLIKPSCWTKGDTHTKWKPRSRSTFLNYSQKIPEPTLSRLEAIKVIMKNVDSITLVVSNIGVPSKEVFAARDRPMNFYMLGSYTQATPIGLGIALKARKKVVVIDGDGSLLGSSVLSVVAAKSPKNLTIICLDNGTFGSTGDQMTNAYSFLDMKLIARANGIYDTLTVSTGPEITKAMEDREGPTFIHALITPGNSDSPNIPWSPEMIKSRFMATVPCDCSRCRNRRCGCR